MGSLAEVSLENYNFFNKMKNIKLHNFGEVFKKLSDNVIKLQSKVDEIESFASGYDFSDEAPGNGYRSFVCICDSAVMKAEEVCVVIQKNRHRFIFRRSFYEKEINAYVGVFENLNIIADSLVENHHKSSDNRLYSEDGDSSTTVREIMDSINLESFYGRVAQFHFPDSLKRQTISMEMMGTIYSDYYFSEQNWFLKMLRLPQACFKYYLNPDKRSQRFVDILRNAQLDFGISLVNLFKSNLYKIYEETTQHRLKVNLVFTISPEPLQLFSSKLGELVEIPVPSSYIGNHPIFCRLLCKCHRQGMLSIKAGRKTEKPSRYLIIHCHGGGWIAQSSRLHGIYLREWAAKMDVPILSIDYSLAPEVPFPRALEEVFYAYCWALKNMEYLGSTGENIVFVGDSAGANLMTSCVIKCIEMGIPKPKGLFVIYAALMLNHVFLPSKVLSLMDIIIPYNTYDRCINAYSSGFHQKQPITKNREIPKSPQNEFDRLIPVNYLMAPYWAPLDILAQFPRTIVLSTNFDPCLDECVEFARKLKYVGTDVQLDVLEGLNHSFLNFILFSRECHEGSKVCMQRLSQLLVLK